MRQREERFQGQGKHKGKQAPLFDKQPTGQAKPLNRFSPQDFSFNDDNTCTCPAGRTLTSVGSIYTTATGLRYQLCEARDEDCQSCKLREHLSPQPQTRLHTCLCS